MSMMQPHALHTPPSSSSGAASQLQSHGGPVIQGKLEVTLERNADGKTMTMGLTAKGCIQDTCIFSSPVFNHTEIPGKPL
jgi:hypothetical protein